MGISSNVLRSRRETSKLAWAIMEKWDLTHSQMREHLDCQSMSTVNSWLSGRQAMSVIYMKRAKDLLNKGPGGNGSGISIVPAIAKAARKESSEAVSIMRSFGENDLTPNERLQVAQHLLASAISELNEKKGE